VLRAVREVELLRRRGDLGRRVRLPLNARMFEVHTSSTPLSPPDERIPETAPPTDTLVSEQLWHDVHERLTAFVARRVDEPADVADLVQTVFLRAHANAGAVTDQERLLPWLFSITRNAIADHYRSPARRREVTGDAADGALEHGASDGAGDVTALADLSTCVRPMLQQLPPTYREALERVEFEGVSQRDVAAELGISVSGLKSRVQRGRAMLREVLLACCEISRSATGGVLDYSRRPGRGCGSTSGGSAGRCA
jgi:RNA polymerase sigma-70 factor (ECF subfamily)